jgi:DoxX-like family
METTQAIHMPKTYSHKGRLTGRIISILCILFLLFDAIMKVIRERHSIEASAQLGWPEHLVQPIGIALLLSTILYAIPRTAFVGAILLTGYLGGATATMVRTGQPLYFAVAFGILVWVGLFLREPRLRGLISSPKE